MKKNMGKIDRGIRIIAGLVLIPLAFVGPAQPWFLLGIIPLATGLAGFCPAYLPFGIKTCRRKESL